MIRKFLLVACCAVLSTSALAKDPTCAELKTAVAGIDRATLAQIAMQAGLPQSKIDKAAACLDGKKSASASQRKSRRASR